jgi:hypothetical protein
MAAVAHTKTNLLRNLTGVNLTDATFQTLVAGASNGATFALLVHDVIILKNDTAGAGIFTFSIPVPSSISSYGGTLTSPTITVAAGKTVALRIDEVFKDITTGLVTITCDIAGKLLVLNCP